jgi:3-hydroxyacyl-CoA dehydrogenase
MGLSVAPAAKALVDAQGDNARWYGGDAAEPTQWVPEHNDYDAVVRRPGMIILEARKEAGAVIEKNKSATLVDLGDGVACVEFHSKLNSLNADIVTMLRDAVPILGEKGGFRGLVVGNDASHFSAGADAFSILALAGQNKWDELEKLVDEFQQTMMSLRHGPMPVVVAPHGMTLGGGCECSLHGDAIVAHAELYMGLVDAGIGLVPAGGGLKEIVRRGSAWASQVPDGDPYPWIRRGFEAAGQAKVSTSAHEARSSGFLAPTDKIVFHGQRVIAEAKKRVIGLAEAGYVPPDRNEPIKVIGRNAGASFFLGAQLFAWGGYASAHDKLVGEKVAHVLSGGDRMMPGPVVAQDLLDLEREAFISLCGEQKTKDRIAHTLSTGKPLRN